MPCLLDHEESKVVIDLELTKKDHELKNLEQTVEVLMKESVRCTFSIQ